MTSFLRRHQLKLKANAYNGYQMLLSSYEKLVFQPRSIKCLREGIELYTSPAKPPNKISEKALEISKKKFSLVMKLYGFSESHQLPESPSEKNKIWKEQIQPRLKDAKQLRDYLSNMTTEDKEGILSCSEGIEEFIKSAKEENTRQKEIAASKLRKQKRRAEEAKRRELGLAEEADVELASKLIELSTAALRKEAADESCFLYFKVWTLKDKTTWYKIGISNNLQRREAEQNVLPVPAKTIGSVRFPSANQARAAEAAFHETLKSMRITGANNKELFHLSPQQAKAVLSAINHFKKIEV